MSLALYRKYRPGTFAEVKGQEHVTDPLRQALRSGRINHAYLFSGPRGCGKTSSARILARSLNCAQGPTPDPCGVCDSCVALSATGPGHLDVIEIDAASHGGVDDARDLRERAFFSPVSARFKIYIIDEAHMVTREGFNALLKLVEEPPPHLKFIFATTEPEKVIGTIKSRTHHYPFRLMPPSTLRQLLEEILGSESVPYEPAALPLVVRAGAGSARDSLSILDQLLAGSDEAGITYARAVSLLGYTDAGLLDEVVDAFSAGDGGLVFKTVERVVEGGHDPRRFAGDLLERFRDLVILANVPEAASNGLLDAPTDELERMQAQVAKMGVAELTRAAEVFNAGLTEMRGATSPRLLLELMCARLLLPAATRDEAALLARLDRLERGVSGFAVPASGGSVPTTAGPAEPRQAIQPVAPAHPHSEPPAPAPSAAPSWPEARTAVRPSGDRPSAPEPTSSAPPASVPGGSGVGSVQQAWPQILEAVKRRQRVAWGLINAEGRLLGVQGNTITLGFKLPGTVKGFLAGNREAPLAAALQDVLGGKWRVEVVVGGDGPPSSGSFPQSRAGTASAYTAGSPAPQRASAAPDTSASGPAVREAATPVRATVSSVPPTSTLRPTPSPSAPGAVGGGGTADDFDEVDEVDPLNDSDAEVTGVTGIALVERELGGRVIGEIDHA
ncbi:DNA polymerase III subunit gamma and tau [Rhizohabitans arisaemae]|uniref:DNA polymerase III subunit gamma and tau n=1 Tax=Rhizohabitans arisaemae TaxID=2720610 RepID=UPI0024B1B1AD|nr:DNA polymerase III subunit gamma and tau [Rhizohabitans arisaemae]